MSKKFFTDIKNIRNAIDSNKLVVFAGAGISVDAGIPNWETLINEMRSEIDIPPQESDYLRIAQMYFNERQQKEYIGKIRDVLKHKKVKHNLIHDAIFKLRPEHILTTNYDDLLEQVILKESLPFSVVDKDKEFPYASNTNLLVKLHGDLNDGDIVLKEDDYLDYSKNHPLMEAFLKSVFASKVVLFVGYGFSDINLKMIIHTVRNILGSDFQYAYLLSIDDKLHPAQREYFKNKGVNVIDYFDGTTGKSTNYITEYLKGKNALRKNFLVEDENLSQKGKCLLNFLVFLSVYDKFNEPLTDKNIIDQIYLSLNRFSELVALPPHFIANLYPFNDSESYMHTYESKSILTKNDLLVDLFFNQVEILNDEVRFKPKADTNLNSLEVEKTEKKLWEIIRVLNQSMIFFLVKENERPKNGENYNWADRFKKLIVKPTADTCNCFNCRWRRFEFKSIISGTRTQGVYETSSIHSDLELAYANQKIGNFYQSYKLYEEIAIKAWQAGKYFSYYIAKYNLKALRNPIQYYENEIDDKERIITKIDNIDFYKLLSQIPYLGEKEYELLRIIRDNEILGRGKVKIEELHGQVLDTHELYKSKFSSRFGSNYPKLIFDEIDKIISFYTNNYIIADYFADLKQVVRTGIDALLISFATDKRYKQRIEEFDKAFYDLIVFYGDSRGLEKLKKKYKIDKIVFTESSQSEIIESANSFLKSFFEEEDNYFGRNTSTVKIIINDFFESESRARFSNIFFVLYSIDLKKEGIGDLVENLLGFIKHQTFLTVHEIENICSFIYHHPSLFSKEHLENLLSAITPQASIFINGGLLKNIAYVFRENKFERISNRKLIFNILSLNENPERKKIIYINLWVISNEEIRESLKEEIIQELNKNFDHDFYKNSVSNEIIDFKMFFEEYALYVLQNIGDSLYNNSKLLAPTPNSTFINLMIFLYTFKIPSNHPSLSKLLKLPEDMLFLVNPEEFDYSKFQIKWLDLFENIEVIWKRFGQIPELKIEIEKALKMKFDSKLAENYTKYFL